MAQWPPSPIVEDLETSLAKEHMLEKNVQQLKSENQPAPSRGCVDQYPIIVESDTQAESSSNESVKTTTPAYTRSKKSSSKMDSYAKNRDYPLTPPPSDTEAQISRLKPEVRAPRSKSTTRLDERASSRGRPPITRIKTNVQDDIPRMNTRVRRSSPYSYTRESGTFKVNPEERSSGESFLSPVHATLSPESAHLPSRTSSDAKHQHSQEGSEDLERKSTRQIRFSDDNQYSEAPVHHPKRPSSAIGHVTSDSDKKSHSRIPSDTLTPPDSRRQSKGSPNTSGAEDRHRSHRHSSQRHHHSHHHRHHHNSEKSRESPYASSAEESIKSDRVRRERKLTTDNTRPRQRSSHRRERPRFEECFAQLGLHDLRPSDDASVHRRERTKDHPSPMVSPMASTPKTMEDYFNQAFKENQSRHPKTAKRTSVDESAIMSPPTSPPRTPKTERKSGQDYFETPSTSSQRPQPRSRQPSLEDSQLRDLKAHTTLLSQATAGAAMAARSGPPLTRSSSSSNESPPTTSTSMSSSGQRSRIPSPVPEEPRPTSRAGSFTYGDEPRSTYNTAPVKERSRPSTRDGPPATESSFSNSSSQPQRSGSYTGYEHRYQRPLPSQFGPTLTAASALASNIANHFGGHAPLQRSMSAATPAEFVRPTNHDLVLPQCPRFQPTRGFRDWCTIRDASKIDLCPTCADAIGTTHYRNLIVRSPEKPYNEYTTCALSKPWVRIAVAQSLKQNKPDLKLISDVNTLPNGVRPCSGPHKDVRVWWTMVDPTTDKPLQEFFACSACTLAVDTIFPEIKKVWERDTLNQEKICSLQHTSKHFAGFVDQFEQAALRCKIKGYRSRYMQPLVDHIRKVLRYPECPGDNFLTNRAWHFMSDLPEFTICEECYEHVVWPIHEKPIARDISKTTKVASSKIGGQHGISCQLSSERMKKMFHEAVAGRNFEHLKAQAKERYATQHRLHAMNRMYEDDQKLGWDRRAELQKNKDYWKSMA